MHMYSSSLPRAHCSKYNILVGYNPQGIFTTLKGSLTDLKYLDNNLESNELKE